MLWWEIIQYKIRQTFVKEFVTEAEQPGAKDRDSRAGCLGLNPILSFISSETNYLTYLCLHFLMCKREIVMVAYLIGLLRGLND